MQIVNESIFSSGIRFNYFQCHQLDAIIHWRKINLDFSHELQFIFTANVIARIFLRFFFFIVTIAALLLFILHGFVIQWFFCLYLVCVNSWYTIISILQDVTHSHKTNNMLINEINWSEKTRYYFFLFGSKKVITIPLLQRARHTIENRIFMITNTQQ